MDWFQIEAKLVDIIIAYYKSFRNCPLYLSKLVHNGLFTIIRLMRRMTANYGYFQIEMYTCYESFHTNNLLTF